MKLRKHALAAACFGALLFAYSDSARAGAVLTSGNVTIGINPEGNLIDQGPEGVIPTPLPTGSEGNRFSVFLKDVGDALSPGCACEAWGASAGSTVGHAGVSNGGISNITVDSFNSTSTTATSVTHLTSLAALEITQHYQPSKSAALFEDVVTIKNTGATTLTDVRYSRTMDWDIPPNEFSEFVTIKGTTTTSQLLHSGDNGFATPDPTSTSFSSLVADKTDATDSGPADHGFAVAFGFGDLEPGATKTFSIFYGADYTETKALEALGTVGAELYSLGQTAKDKDNTPTFIFAFKGVGGVVIEPPPDGGGGGGGGAVPLPAAAWMGLSTLGGLGVVRKIRRRLAK
jgi:type IV pilus assembly protein PilY1